MEARGGVGSVGSGRRERPGQGSPALSLCPFAPAERVLELPTEHPSCPPRPEGHLEGQVLVITSVLLGLLLLLLLAWSLAAFFLWAPRGNACCSHCCSQAEAQAPPTASLPYSYLLHPHSAKLCTCPIYLN